MDTISFKHYAVPRPLFLIFVIALVLWTENLVQADVAHKGEAKKEPEYKCLKEEWDENSKLYCREETLDLYKRSAKRYIDAAATRGDSLSNYLESLRDLESETRENYEDLIEEVGENIYPLIMATDEDTPEDSEEDLSGVGAVYTLYLRNGTTERVAPMSKDYEMHEILSRTALGIFATISPYFRVPEARSWRPAVSDYHEKVKDALAALPLVPAHESLNKEDRKHGLTMLMLINNYLTNCLSGNSVNQKDFQEFAGILSPYIVSSMKKAAFLQVEETLPVLKKWKRDLGKEWEKTFVVITSEGSGSQINSRLQILEKVMSFKQIKENVVVVEGSEDEDEARTQLGRVIADRALAQLVFGGSENENMKDHVYSLSTQRDVMSTLTAKAIQDYCKEASVIKERC